MTIDTKPNIMTTGSQMAAAMGFHGPSGSGKTSLASCFPRPVVAMVRDQGLLPLIDTGMVLPVAHGRGLEFAVSTFSGFLRRLDLLRAKKIAVEILAHSKVATFSNPTGADYSRFIPDVKDKLWALLHKWLDLFAFLTFDVEIKPAAGGKGKATGGARRVLYTEERPGFVAKNRFGLAFAIQGDGPGAGPLYAAFAGAMREAKARNKQTDPVSLTTEVTS